MNKMPNIDHLAKSCFKEWPGHELPVLRGMERRLSELQHGAALRIGEPLVDPAGMELQLTWSAWGLIEKTELLTLAAEAFIKKIIESGWEFSTVCPTSSTGCPIATLVATRLEKKLIAVDGITGQFYPREPKQGEKLILIDTIIKSGHHLRRAIEEISYYGAHFAGAMTIAYHDAWTGLKDPDLESFIDNGSVLFLHKISTFYEAWIKEKSRDSKYSPATAPPETAGV